MATSPPFPFSFLPSLIPLLPHVTENPGKNLSEISLNASWDPTLGTSLPTRPGGVKGHRVGKPGRSRKGLRVRVGIQLQDLGCEVGTGCQALSLG